MLNNSCLVVNAVLVIGDLRPKGVHTANRKGIGTVIMGVAFDL